MADYTIDPPAQTVSDDFNAPGAVTTLEYHADGQELVMVIAAPGHDPIHSPKFPASDVPDLNLANLKAEADRIKKHVIETFGGGTPV